MLKIKLARFGKKKQPHYRIVVNEARDKRDGKFVAIVGHYAPTQVPKILELDLKLVEEWMKKGAQPTETVASLIERVKSGKLFGDKKKSLSKKAKIKLEAAKKEAEKPVEKPAPKVEVAPEVAAEAAVEAVPETPAAE